MGEYGQGIISSFHYSEALASDMNRNYTQAFYKANPGVRPNFMSVAGYDGMHLIKLALAKTNGDTSAEKFVEAAKGLSWDSPRGPVRIDPETRDIVQDIYIRKAELIDGKLQNVEFDRIEQFRDPAKK
jgi:branched-chain amino acid transport system substrate-binding protein